MYSIISLAIDCILNVILVIPVIFIWQNFFYREASARHRWLILLFACCIAEVLAVTGVPSIGSLRVELSVNLVSFRAMLESPVQWFLNILLFVPVGVIAPLIWKRFTKLGSTVLLGFGMSLFIEFMQLFSFRATDIDDLIANTAGAVIGFLVCRLFRKKQVQYDNGSEILILYTLTFLVNFTIQPVLSGAVWSMLI